MSRSLVYIVSADARILFWSLLIQRPFYEFRQNLGSYCEYRWYKGHFMSFRCSFPLGFVSTGTSLVSLSPSLLLEGKQLAFHPVLVLSCLCTGLVLLCRSVALTSVMAFTLICFNIWCSTFCVYTEYWLTLISWHLTYLPWVIFILFPNVKRTSIRYFVPYFILM